MFLCSSSWVRFCLDETMLKKTMLFFFVLQWLVNYKHIEPQTLNKWKAGIIMYFSMKSEILSSKTITLMLVYYLRRPCHGSLTPFLSLLRFDFYIHRYECIRTICILSSYNLFFFAVCETCAEYHDSSKKICLDSIYGW